MVGFAVTQQEIIFYIVVFFENLFKQHQHIRNVVAGCETMPESVQLSTT